jgi:hypothetical protein
MVVKIISSLIATVALSACSTTFGVKTDYDGMRFASELPVGLSSAWVKGGSVWLVPSKNSVIEAASVNGKFVKVSTDGAYFKVPGALTSVDLVINGATSHIKFSEAK